MQKTLVAKQIASQDRSWYVVDAEGQTLGRLATQIARLLTGRDRVDFTPHVDNGANVIVLNAAKFRVSGSKLQQKLYRTHSQFMGGLKETKLENMLTKKPFYALEHAVSGMIPKNRHRKAMVQRLRLELGSTHPYTAQQPQTITL